MVCITHMHRHTQPISDNDPCLPDCTRANHRSGRHTCAHTHTQSTIPAYQTARGQIAGQGDTHMHMHTHTHTHTQSTIPAYQTAPGQSPVRETNTCTHTQSTTPQQLLLWMYVHYLQKTAEGHIKTRKILHIKLSLSYLWRIKLKTPCQTVVENGPGRCICSFAIRESAIRSLRWRNRPRFIIHSLPNTRQVSISNYCLPLPLNIKR